MATTENGTYYPSDYSSVADVPSDMKKMAESIDANKVQKIPGKGLSTNDFTNEYKQKLEDLENYDDTEVKKDISDIKEEQETQNTNIENLQENDTTQDELIEKLQQENKNIKSALINVETEQAKSLHIEDASTVSAQLSVEGNAEQEVREGYNLLDMRDAKGGTSGGITVTINEDGSYKYAGTATSNTINVWLKGGFSNTTPLFTLKAGKKYYIKDVLLFNLHTQLKNANTLVQPEEDIDITGVRAVDAVTGTTYNETYYPMLTENEEKPWEQYGASPSPNYPSKVKCLGSNKNLYPGWEHGTISADTGNNAYDPKYIRSIDFISVFPNKEYTIKAYNIENIDKLNTAVRMYDSNKEYLENLYVGMIHVDSKTFIITNENVKYIKIVSSNESTIIETAKVDIKLEKGEVATSYSPYRTR